MSEEIISVIVEAGNAEPGPAMGTKLGPLGVNIGKMIGEVNQKTKKYEGMEVPVDIIVDTETKEVEVKVGTPSTSQLLMQKADIEEGRITEDEEIEEKWVGEISFEDSVSVAKEKKEKSFSSSLKKVSKEVLGTCNSMGLKVDGKEPSTIIKEIEEGKHEERFES